MLTDSLTLKGSMRPLPSELHIVFKRKSVLKMSNQLLYREWSLQTMSTKLRDLPHQKELLKLFNGVLSLRQTMSGMSGWLRYMQ